MLLWQNNLYIPCSLSVAGKTKKTGRNNPVGQSDKAWLLTSVVQTPHNKMAEIKQIGEI